MIDIIKIIKSLEDSNVLIDGTETVKHKIKKQEGQFLPALLASLAGSLVQPVISSVVKDRGVRRAEMWIKIFSFAPSFKQYRDYQVFQSQT